MSGSPAPSLTPSSSQVKAGFLPETLLHQLEWTRSTQVNREISALLQLFLRDFIYPWSVPITSPLEENSTEFHSLLLRQIKRMIRRLEARLVRMNWVHIIHRQLPQTLHRHLLDYKNCKERWQADRLEVSMHLSMEDYFLLCQPHAALLSAQHELEYLRQLSDHFVDVLLTPIATTKTTRNESTNCTDAGRNRSVDLTCTPPTQDQDSNDEDAGDLGERQSVAVRTLLRDLFVSVLQTAFDRLCEPDFLFQWFLSILDAVQRRSSEVLADPLPPMQQQRERDMAQSRLRLRAQRGQVHGRSRSAHAPQVLQAQSSTVGTDSSISLPSNNSNTDTIRPRSNATLVSPAATTSLTLPYSTQRLSAPAETLHQHSRSHSHEDRASLRNITASNPTSPSARTSNESLQDCETLSSITPPDVSASDNERPQEHSWWSFLQLLAAELQIDSLTQDTKDAPLDECWLSLVNEILALDQKHPFLWSQFTLTVRPLAHLLFHSFIQRSMRLTVDRLFSEKRMAYYVRSAKEALWPDGRFADPPQQRTSEQQQATERELKRRLMDRVPQSVWQWLLDKETFMEGLDMLSDALKSRRLNRHLLFVMLDTLMNALKEEEL